MAGRSWLCITALATYLVVYILAAAYAYVGTKGLLGFEADGLSAVWLIFLGMPWTLMLAMSPAEGLSESVARAFVGLAPLINFVLLLMMCRKRRRR